GPGPGDVGGLNDDDQDDELVALEAVEHGADDRGKVERDHDAVVEDNEGDHELHVFAVVAQAPERRPELLEADGPDAFAGGQRLRTGLLPDEKEERQGKDEVPQRGDGKREPQQEIAADQDDEGQNGGEAQDAT